MGTWKQNIRSERIAPGAVLVFERRGGDHVGFYVGFYVGDYATAYHVLGGNQGDKVSIVRIEKSRCIARRWPAGRPMNGEPVAMKAVPGVPLSRNEA